MFEKASSRTRISFYLAIKQLGGGTLTLRSNELHLGQGGETIADTAKILSTYGDGFMLRTDDDKKIEEKVDISALLALGDISHGEKVFKKCSACHLVNKGGENKIGPALYGVIGRKVASKQDYKYSKAMAAYDKNWTFEEMNGYLKKPQSYIKGTKMAFAGLRKEKDRASVILYLNQNSDNPLPLPLSLIHI